MTVTDNIDNAMLHARERAERQHNAARAFLEVERVIGLLAWHLDNVVVTDHEARNELAGYLDNLRRAIRPLEDDL